MERPAPQCRGQPRPDPYDTTDRATRNNDSPFGNKAHTSTSTSTSTSTGNDLTCAVSAHHVTGC